MRKEVRFTRTQTSTLEQLTKNGAIREMEIMEDVPSATGNQRKSSKVPGRNKEY